MGHVLLASEGAGVVVLGVAAVGGTGGLEIAGVLSKSGLIEFGFTGVGISLSTIGCGTLAEGVEIVEVDCWLLLGAACPLGGVAVEAPSVGTFGVELDECECLRCEWCSWSTRLQ